jgi:molybdopterin-guanine dinucleotide biosynthesis protein A
VRTGIVLAGGRSSRFGSDKLAADFEGQPLLAATIGAVLGVVNGVVVAGPALPPGFTTGEVRVVLVEDLEPLAGPLAALANALDSLGDADPGDDLAIVVGGDMPRLVPGVLRSMLDRLDADRAIDAVLLEAPSSGDGGRAPSPKRAVLPLAVRIEAARRAAAEAIRAGDRSLQALVDRLSHIELPASAWLAIDPQAQTLLDVDTLADLEQLRRK